MYNKAECSLVYIRVECPGVHKAAIPTIPVQRVDPHNVDENVQNDAVHETKSS